MGKAQRRTLFLTGAPTASSLKWTEADLYAPLQPCYSSSRNYDDLIQPSVDKIVPSWRFLSLEKTHLPTGVTPASKENFALPFDSDPIDELSYFTASEFSFASADLPERTNGDSQDLTTNSEEMLSQFYEHSLLIHDVPSSQIISPGSMVENSSTTEAEDFSIESTVNNEISTQEQLVRSRLASGYLSDIKDIPNAAYLRSITPQTMTVNLVVGVITISQPRTLRTRRGGRTVELVEMLVGDETRAGFGINIWLPSPQKSKHSTSGTEDFRSNVLGLRVQDIALVKNVALSSFRGKVHSQSLRRGTTLDLLYRNKVDRDDVPGAFSAKDLDREAVDVYVLKLKRVKDWVMQFVGNNARPPTGNYSSHGPVHPAKRKALESLPLDTP